MSRVKFIALSGILTALTAVATLISIPVPAMEGFINVGDSIIFVIAIINPFIALIAGGIGSMLADLILGYAVWMPFTLVIKGLEGLVAGLLVRVLIKNATKLDRLGRIDMAKYCLAMFIGGLFMIGGYFLAGIYMYGINPAVAGIGFNAIQLLASMII